MTGIIIRKRKTGFWNAAKKNVYQRRTYFIGLLLVFLIYLMLYIWKGMYPFGSEYRGSDSYLQCLPFMNELHRKLFSFESMQYSWATGMGGDFISVIGYYLSSPLSFYYVFFSGKTLYAVVSFSTILKAMLAYTTMYYYLVKRIDGQKNSNRIELILFSGIYVLNNLFFSFSVFYPFQDVMILLPLVMLGLEQFVQGKGRKLYFVTLILTILSNYYLGAMVCLFVILYYFTLNFESVKSFFKISVRVLYTSLLAIGCTTVLLLPAIMSLQHNSDNLSEYSGAGFLNNWFDVLQQFFFLSKPVLNISQTFEYWKGNLYMGMLVMLLAFCYFFNKKVSWQQRIRRLVLLVLLVLSLNEALTNYVMNLFHYSTGLPNRQVLFLLFLCIGMGHSSFMALMEDSKNISRIPMAFIIVAMLVLICLNVLYVKELGLIEMYVGTFGLVVVYGLCLLLQKRFECQKNFVRVLVVLGTLELLVGTVYVQHMAATITIKGVLSDYDMLSEMTEEIKDDGFYHITKNNTYFQPNAGSLVGFRGIEAFSSLIPTDYMNTLAKLGNCASYNQLLDFTHTPFLNSLLNVKYIISNEVKEPDNQYSRQPMDQYMEVRQKGDYKIYENKTVLSPVIVAQGELEPFEEEIKAYAENEKIDFGTLQNTLLHALCGEETGELFTDVKVKIEDVKSENCVARMMNGNMLIANNMSGSNEDSAIPYDSNKNSKATVTFTPLESGELYCMGYKLRYCGNLSKDEQHNVAENIPNNGFDGFGIYASNWSFKLYHPDVWETSYNQLATQQMEITDYTDSTLEGYLSSDGRHKVFTSIPYDRNWKVYVDGEQVETSAIADAFLSFTIDKGEHQVRMVYSNPYIFVGIVISLLCVLLSFVIWQHNRKKAGVSGTL